MLIGSQWICFFLFPLCMAVLNCGTVTRTKWTYIFRNQSLCFTNEYIRLRLMQQVGSSTFNSGQICMREIRLSKEVLIVILGKLREIEKMVLTCPQYIVVHSLWVLPKKYVHFFTDNIVRKVSSGQICPRFLRTCLSSNIVEVLTIQKADPFPYFFTEH